jgi:hypothetical protein
MQPVVTRAALEPAGEAPVWQKPATKDRSELLAWLAAAAKGGPRVAEELTEVEWQHWIDDAFYAGLRRGEIHRLEWPEVLDGDAIARRIVVLRSESEAGTQRRPRSPTRSVRSSPPPGSASLTSGESISGLDPPGSGRQLATVSSSSVRLVIACRVRTVVSTSSMSNWLSSRAVGPAM